MAQAIEAMPFTNGASVTSAAQSSVDVSAILRSLKLRRESCSMAAPVYSSSNASDDSALMRLHLSLPSTVQPSPVLRLPHSLGTNIISNVFHADESFKQAFSPIESCRTTPRIRSLSVYANPHSPTSLKPASHLEYISEYAASHVKPRVNIPDPDGMQLSIGCAPAAVAAAAQATTSRTPILIAPGPATGRPHEAAAPATTLSPFISASSLSCLPAASSSSCLAAASISATGPLTQALKTASSMALLKEQQHHQNAEETAWPPLSAASLQRVLYGGGGGPSATGSSIAAALFSATHLMSDPNGRTCCSPPATVDSRCSLLDATNSTTGGGGGATHAESAGADSGGREGSGMMTPQGRRPSGVAATAFAAASAIVAVAAAAADAEDKGGESAASVAAAAAEVARDIVDLVSGRLSPPPLSSQSPGESLPPPRPGVEAAALLRPLPPSPGPMQRTGSTAQEINPRSRDIGGAGTSICDDDKSGAENHSDDVGPSPYLKLHLPPGTLRATAEEGSSSAASPAAATGQDGGQADGATDTGASAGNQPAGNQPRTTFLQKSLSFRHVAAAAASGSVSISPRATSPSVAAATALATSAAAATRLTLQHQQGEAVTISSRMRPLWTVNVQLPESDGTQEVRMQPSLQRLEEGISNADGGAVTDITTSTGQLSHEPKNALGAPAASLAHPPPAGQTAAPTAPTTSSPLRAATNCSAAPVNPAAQPTSSAASAAASAAAATKSIVPTGATACGITSACAASSGGGGASSNGSGSGASLAAHRLHLLEELHAAHRRELALAEQLGRARAEVLELTAQLTRQTEAAVAASTAAAAEAMAEAELRSQLRRERAEASEEVRVWRSRASAAEEQLQTALIQLACLRSAATAGSSGVAIGRPPLKSGHSATGTTSASASVSNSPCDEVRCPLSSQSALVTHTSETKSGSPFAGRHRSGDSGCGSGGSPSLSWRAYAEAAVSPRNTSVEPPPPSSSSSSSALRRASRMSQTELNDGDEDAAAAMTQLPLRRSLSYQALGVELGPDTTTRLPRAVSTSGGAEGERDVEYESVAKLDGVAAAASSGSGGCMSSGGGSFPPGSPPIFASAAATAAAAASFTQGGTGCSWPSPSSSSQLAPAPPPPPSSASTAAVSSCSATTVYGNASASICLTSSSQGPSQSYKVCSPRGPGGSGAVASGQAQEGGCTAERGYDAPVNARRADGDGADLAGSLMASLATAASAGVGSPSGGGAVSKADAAVAQITTCNSAPTPAVAIYLSVQQSSGTDDSAGGGGGSTGSGLPRVKAMSVAVADTRVRGEGAAYGTEVVAALAGRTNDTDSSAEICRTTTAPLAPSGPARTTVLTHGSSEYTPGESAGSMLRQSSVTLSTATKATAAATVALATTQNAPSDGNKAENAVKAATALVAEVERLKQAGNRAYRSDQFPLARHCYTCALELILAPATSGGVPAAAAAVAAVSNDGGGGSDRKAQMMSGSSSDGGVLKVAAAATATTVAPAASGGGSGGYIGGAFPGVGDGGRRRKLPGEQRMVSALYCSRAAAHVAMRLYADAVADCCAASAHDGGYAKPWKCRAEALASVNAFGPAAAALERCIQLITAAATAVSKAAAASKAATTPGGGCSSGGGETVEFSDVDPRELPLLRHILQRLQELARAAAAPALPATAALLAAMSGAPSGTAPPVDHYAVLGVPYHATAVDVRAAHRRLALRYHPDKAAAAAAAAVTAAGASSPIRAAVVAAASTVFPMVAEAYAVLSDSASRRAYDLRRARVALSSKRHGGGGKEGSKQGVGRG